MNFLDGKRTYIVGIAMIVHGVSTMFLHGMVDQISTMEVMNGLGLFFLRGAVG